MKKIAGKLVSLLVLSIFLISATRQQTRAQDVVVSYQTFYDELSPYGQWVEDPQYGNVWVPNEEPGYRPYATRGHWAMTDYGNMWVSDVPWGWACYHYGRWTYNPYYGWVWIPGHEWAPAWVSWRSGGGYYGWAPMGPGFVMGSAYDYPENYWVFVGPEYLYHPNVYSYYEPRHCSRFIRRSVYINETHVYGGNTYYYGPRREVIERESHQPVQVYRVSDAHTPQQIGARGNEVAVYRPSVNRGSTARPTNVIRGSQPVGQPQQISRGYGSRQPEFRQVVQQRNQPAQGRSQAQSEPNRQSMNQVQEQRVNRTEQSQQQFGRPQPQQFNRGEQQSQQFGRPQPQQFNRGEQQPQQQQQQFGRPQQQQFNRGEQQPQQQPNRPQFSRGEQQQFSRPQPQQQQQQFGRPQQQSQPQQQSGRPQPQPQQRPQPEKKDESNSGGPRRR